MRSLSKKLEQSFAGAVEKLFDDVNDGMSTFFLLETHYFSMVHWSLVICVPDVLSLELPSDLESALGVDVRLYLGKKLLNRAGWTTMVETKLL